MNSVKLVNRRAQLNRFVLPIVLTLLFVLYYAFGSFVQNVFVQSETGKNAVGMLLSYSSMAFLGILLFIIFAICKKELNQSKVIYFTLLAFSLSVTIVYSVLALEIVSNYFNSICNKLELVYAYTSQIRLLNSITLTNVSMTARFAILFAVLVSIVVCYLLTNCLGIVFIQTTEHSECGYTYANTLLENENLGFLYFALS